MEVESAVPLLLLVYIFYVVTLPFNAEEANAATENCP